jgi:pimeloyl-ACP methyl ester carboxylesterase
MAKLNGIVLVHGAWHDHHTWDNVLPLLASADIVAKAVDLPGAGVHAARPVSFGTRPLDPIAFGTEPSPNAGVMQAERTKAVVAAVREVNATTGGKAIIVGHSLGGLTVSPVVEAIHDEISAVVYLTAFMLSPGMAGVQMIMHELMSRALVPGLFLADPAKVGALRIDVRSEDPEYVARTKQAFFADLTDDQFEAARRHLHPDEPAQVAGVPSAVSKDKFGQVARHYIECLADNAITLEGQREMIRLMDEAMENKTIVHSLNSSHSPFHSMPSSLVQILSSIGF